MLYEEVYKRTLDLKDGPGDKFFDWVRAFVFWDINVLVESAKRLLNPMKDNLNENAESYGIVSASVYAFNFLLPEGGRAFPKLSECNWKANGIEEVSNIKTELYDRWVADDVSDAPSKKLIDAYDEKLDLKKYLYSRDANVTLTDQSGWESVCVPKGNSIPSKLFDLYPCSKYVLYLPACSIATIDKQIRQVPMLSLMLWLNGAHADSIGYVQHQLLPALIRCSDFLCSVSYSAELNKRNVASEMYNKIEKRLNTIRGLRESFMQLGVALDGIEDVINPHRFLRGKVALDEIVFGLKKMFDGIKHDVAKWNNDDIKKLNEEWSSVCHDLKEQLDTKYDLYFGDFHEEENIGRAAAYILKAVKDGFCPLKWIVEDAEVSQALDLDNEVPPLALAFAIRDEKIAVKLQVDDDTLEVKVSIKDDGRSLKTLKAKSLEKANGPITDLTSEHTSGILALITQGSRDGRKALEAALVQEGYLNCSFGYLIKEVK